MLSIFLRQLRLVSVLSLAPIEEQGLDGATCPLADLSRTRAGSARRGSPLICCIMQIG